MKKVMNSKALLSVISLVLIAAMALSFAACSNDETENPAGNTQKTFVFKVVDLDGTEKSFDIKTDAETVGEALLAEELISGSTSEYGLMVDTVNGIKYDYTADGAYWAFYIDGEYAMSGIDSTDITEGATYSFVATKAE